MKQSYTTTAPINSPLRQLYSVKSNSNAKDYIILPPKAILPKLFVYNQCTTSKKSRTGRIAFGGRMMKDLNLNQTLPFTTSALSF